MFGRSECPNCGEEYEKNIQPPNHVPDKDVEYDSQSVEEGRICIEYDGGVRDHGVPRQTTIYIHEGGGRDV